MAIPIRSTQFENPFVAKLIPQASNQASIETVNMSLRENRTTGLAIIYTKLKTDYQTMIDNQFKKNTPNALATVDGIANWEKARNLAYKQNKILFPFKPEFDLNPEKYEAFTKEQQLLAKNIDAFQQLLNANPNKSANEIITTVLTHAVAIDPKRIDTAITALDNSLSTNKQPLIDKIKGIIDKSLTVEETHLTNLLVIKEAHKLLTANSFTAMLYDPVAKQIDAAIERTNQITHDLNQNQDKLNQFINTQKSLPLEVKMPEEYKVHHDNKLKEPEVSVRPRHP